MKPPASILFSAATPIRDAMRRINEAGVALGLAIADDGRLEGVVTDGDIRRAILDGVSLEGSLEIILNKKPTTVSVHADLQEVRRLFLQTGHTYIPAVDDAGRLSELISIGELLTLPLSAPDITDLEAQAVLEVLRSGDLSLGPKLGQFEEALAAYAGRAHAVAVNSGTSGLHLVIKALGIGRGDEVITTPFSFIASSNCILYEDAVPAFCDIDPRTFNIDPDRIEACITTRTKAILAVDVFGQPACYDELEAIAEKHGLALVSDCCESIGARYKEDTSSRRGIAGVFAFYPNKQITTGEGGAIITDDDRVAALCRSMRNQGRSERGGWLSHERLGYNYRLSDLNCAIGIVQLQRIEQILQKREAVAQTYNRLLAGVPEVAVPFIHPDVTRMSWFVYVVRLSDEFTREDRDAICRELRRLGVSANTYFQPIHLQPFYAERFGFRKGMFPVTEAASARTIALPFFSQLAESDVARVVAALREAIDRLPRAARTAPVQ